MSTDMSYLNAEKSELIDRIAARLTTEGGVGQAEATRLAEIVIRGWLVRDEYEVINTTTLSEQPGQSWIESRFLVARWRVENQHYSRSANRNVEADA